jgi:hypothetical protein
MTKEKPITQASRDQLAEMIDKTDWKRIAALSDAEIARAAAEDPDAAMTTAADWSDVQIIWPPATEPVTLRLDREVLGCFGSKDVAIKPESTPCFAPSLKPKTRSVTDSRKE